MVDALHRERRADDAGKERNRICLSFHFEGYKPRA